MYYLVTASVLMEVICCLGSSTPSDAGEIGGKKVWHSLILYVENGF